MANVVVVGSQWGDEGKGKIVDWLSERADVVVRFQGGHNAGHTLVVDGVTYKLSLLPSGVVRKGKLSVIGNGVVIDPWALAEEIAKIEKLGVGISRDNLRIAENATLILPLHRELDSLRESSAGDGRIGTTKRGIGPAYEDKVGRRAIRVMDLQDLSSLKPKIERILAHHNPLRKGLGQPELSPDALCAELTGIAPKILPYVDTVWALLDAKRRQGKRILFEGAQGALLDIDHGTYPFVTSSNTVAAQAATGSGLGPGAIDYVLGITKAYTTRVGEGPFPTELKDETGRTDRRARRRVRHGYGASAPLRLVRRVPRAPDAESERHQRHRAHQARRSRPAAGAQDLRGLQARRPRARPSARGARRASPGRADLRDDGGLDRIDARGAVLGRASRAMHQICAPARGADRRACGSPLDKPEARGHHPRARSLRGLVSRIGHVLKGISPHPAACSGHPPLRGGRETCGAAQNSLPPRFAGRVGGVQSTAPGWGG